MVQWIELTKKKVLERELQALFEAWHTRDAAWLFGVSDWLDAIDVPPLEKCHRKRRSFGYDFTPDIEFIVGPLRYVLELKHGDKFEPQALAEVLHHAAWTKRYQSGAASQVVPVIVSQYNSWLRLAIDEYLRGVIRYVETIVLAVPGEGQIFAFDAPLAAWTVEPPPGWLVELDPRAATLRWHHVAETRSWFGLEQELPARPAILDHPYVWISGGAGRPVLLWEGLAARRGELWRSLEARDLDADGRYFLSGADRPAAAVGTAPSPTWLA